MRKAPLCVHIDHEVSWFGLWPLGLIEGIGSPRTPKNHIWPLSIIARGLVDTSVRDEMKDMVERTNVGGKAHESFHRDEFTKYTRKDFSWPNALFTEL